MADDAPTGYVARQIGSLAISPVSAANPMPIVRAAAWHNRLLRIFLAFLLPGFGSMVGSWVGGYEILSNLF